MLLRATALLLLVAVAMGAYVLLRPNRAQVDPRLGVESWTIVADGLHNSNTDLIAWRDGFLLVHASSPWHLGSTASRLRVKRSDDGRSWETLAELQVEGHDIRDPKVVEIDGRLHLYALPNEGRMATPVGTLLSTSEDAVTWSPWQPVGPEGWLFWRPKTPDGRTWYVSAYWHEHGRSMLLRSEDGVAWEEVSIIHEGDGNDETAIEFLPDGRLLATARLEITPDALLGHDDAGTLLAVAEPPYTEWRKARSEVARLDGPALFSHDGVVYAVARYQPLPHRTLWKRGGMWSRKRTSVYRVEPERLVWLSDLPSAGDTSYAGVVVRDGTVWTEYYTSRIDRDYPWLLAMFLPTDLRMARFPAEALAALSEAHP